MKKLLIGLIGMVFVLGLAFSQTNFEKAAQTEWAKRNSFLIPQAEMISTFHADMANDAVISGKEMKALKKMVSDFDKTQKKFNKELKFYEARTSASIPDVVREHLKIYFERGNQNPTFWDDCSDNKSQDIRRWFVKKTGYDIKVETAKYYAKRIDLGIVLGIILGIISMLIAANIDKTSKDKVVIIIGSAVFAATLACFIFVL